jgi:hypothetical protein
MRATKAPMISVAIQTMLRGIRRERLVDNGSIQAVCESRILEGVPQIAVTEPVIVIVLQAANETFIIAKEARRMPQNFFGGYATTFHRGIVVLVGDQHAGSALGPIGSPVYAVAEFVDCVGRWRTTV